MAFVCCEQRWNIGKENSSPGPAQYSLAENHERNHYYLKRAKSPARIKQIFTSPTNIIQKQPEETAIRQSVKKGKLHRNHSNIVRGRREAQGEKTQLKVTIKNAMHSSVGIVSSRNKWGNMRIKEMLNQHRQKELKKQVDQLHKRHNSRDILCETQQKAHQGLKQLQGFFLSQRKGSNPNIAKKSNLSKKQARHFSYNQLRVSQISKDEMQIEPTLVYTIENNYNQNNKRQESSIIKISPICSLGESKVVLDYSIPTGIQGEQEDSIEYISQATPGPGSYNPSLPSSKISTKIEKFGVTMERFSNNRKKQLQAQTPITPHQPVYRVSSKANQQKVGFGRSKKQGSPEISSIHNGVFYDDFNSLERQAQMLLLNRNNKIGFGSSKERFQNNSNSANEQQIYQPVQEQQEQEFEQNKPTCVFLSKVTRELYDPKSQSAGQFFAQNAFCLANKLKSSKNRVEDYDLKPAPFLSNSNRFSTQPLMLKEIKTLKDSLDQQFLPREHKKINKIEQPKRGFSFGKQQRRENFQRTSPSPGEYQSASQWIKASYNIRFT